jgi:formamidopyrimidine-DNA glycosylase
MILPKSFPNAQADVEEFLINAEVVKVRRRAKVLMIDLSTNYSLVIHLKMTGQMVYDGSSRSSVSSRRNSSGTDVDMDKRFGAGHPNDSLIGQLPDKSTRVTISFADGSKLFFNDQRKFGWMRLLPTIEIMNIDFFKRVGPEPLQSDFTPKVFIQRLQRRKKSSIKSVLLDQSVLAGIGNIYADESLWGAKIHPESKIYTLTDAELQALHSEIVYVLNLAIEKGGSTDRNYVNAEGKKGSYISFARVFRKEGQPCKRCGSTIIKTKVAGRGTHVCPNCQKIAPDIRVAAVSGGQRRQSRGLGSLGTAATRRKGSLNPVTRASKQDSLRKSRI